MQPPRCVAGEYHGPVDRHRQRERRAVNRTTAVERLRADEMDVRDQISVFDIDEAVDRMLTGEQSAITVSQFSIDTMTGFRSL